MGLLNFKGRFILPYFDTRLAPEILHAGSKEDF